ncbi:small integral membrane protein 40-like [Trichosurus vulpecula]|uniref:small integral membrane protein 40-like n=1 Tax=Trichosurus vulpecula TaxID=9337 RepID=UPI00186B5148|nr:small integral membrane protein 40-like [Trichosurus vulpecula]
MSEEEGERDEGDVFLAFAQGPAPPRGPFLRALEGAFFIFLALFLTVLMLRGCLQVALTNTLGKPLGWLLGTPQREEELEL